MTDARDREHRSTSRLQSVALASVSPRRRFLLETLGLDVVTVVSSYDERSHAGKHRDPAELVQAHAIGKADAAARHGPRVLVAADTAVVIDCETLGKPHDVGEARAMLTRLAGRTHTVHTGFAVVDRQTGRRESGVESALVTFLPMNDDEIARYVATGEPLDKAGAYGIQGHGALFVASITGDFYTVMGLPLARLGRAFSSLGFELL